MPDVSGAGPLSRGVSRHRMRMKRNATALLIAAFIVWAIVDAVHEFRANETAKFYSSHPERLLCVLAIAVVGGVVAILFYRLSPSSQRRAKLFALGGVAIFLTANQIAGDNRRPPWASATAFCLSLLLRLSDGGVRAAVSQHHRCKANLLYDPTRTQRRVYIGSGPEVCGLSERPRGH